MFAEILQILLLPTDLIMNHLLQDIVVESMNAALEIWHSLCAGAVLADNKTRYWYFCETCKRENVTWSLTCFNVMFESDAVCSCSALLLRTLSFGMSRMLYQQMKVI